MSANVDVASAYDATGAAWQAGPGRIYDRLADVLVGMCPTVAAGALVLDVGAGTGAATRAAQRAGARAIAVDVSVGMLAAGATRRSPAAVADARALPFERSSFDAAVAAFSLNHIADPGAGLREAVRVLRPGRALVAAAYAENDHHPVKAAVEAAVTAAGWEPEPWYVELRRDAMPLLATVERMRATATAAGLAGAAVEQVDVPFPDLGAGDLVAWRLGMAQVAPFVARLPAVERDALVTDALARLGTDPPPLVRSIIVLTAAAPA